MEHRASSVPSRVNFARGGRAESCRSIRIIVHYLRVAQTTLIGHGSFRSSIRWGAWYPYGHPWRGRTSPFQSPCFSAKAGNRLSVECLRIARPHLEGRIRLMHPYCLQEIGVGSVYPLGPARRCRYRSVYIDLLIPIRPPRVHLIPGNIMKTFIL